MMPTQKIVSMPEQKGKLIFVQEMLFILVIHSSFPHLINKDQNILHGAPDCFVVGGTHLGHGTRLAVIL